MYYVKGIFLLRVYVDMKKRVMILGAGIFQLPLIQKAKEMGYETLVVSYAGRYPGTPIADIFLEIDTTKIDEILDAARAYKISGIVTTGTDVSVPALGAVVDALGLRGPTKWMACTASSKTSFRTLLRDNGLQHPDFCVCRSAEDVKAFARQSTQRIVVKPDDSSGSRGVTVLDKNPAEETIMSAWQKAQCFSRNGLVCAETFIRGTEVGGDAFFKDGNLLFIGTTKKHLMGVIVQGHSFPCVLTPFESKLVENEILGVVKALGYTDGPINFDVMLNETGVTVLEIGLRSGGNGIPDLILRNRGVDLLAWTLEHALENSLSKARVSCTQQEISSYIFGSPRSGKLLEVSNIQSLHAEIPQIFSMTLAKTPGDLVSEFTHNANLVGYLLIHCGAEEYYELIPRIQEVLKVAVEV